MPHGMEVGIGLGPGDFVFDGDQLPPEKGHTHPYPIFAHVCCGQTAGWIKMPLGTEVNLGLGDVVLDRVAVPPKRSTAQPLVFGSCLLWPNGWMDEDTTWYRIDLGPGHIVLEGVPALRERGTAAPPLFSAHVYCGHGRPSQLLLSCS